MELRQPVRKCAAAAVVGTFVGLVTEAQMPDGRWQRAPVTGALVLAVVVLLGWAADELEGKHDGV